MFTIVMGKKNKAVNIASCWTLQCWRDTPQGGFFYFFHPRGRGMNFALLIDRTFDYLNSYINMPEHVYIADQQTVPRSWKSSKTFRNLLTGGLLNIHNISSKSYLPYHVIHIMSGSKTVRKLGHTNKKARIWSGLLVETHALQNLLTLLGRESSLSLLRRAFVKILGTVLIKLKQKRPQ